MASETTLELLVWERLAVFAGGGTLEAVEAICGDAGVAPGALVDLLARLVADGRVVLTAPTEPSGAARYAVPDCSRETARAALTSGGALETAERQHFAYYLALAERARPELVRPQAAMWLDRLQAEHANFQAALAWARDHGEAEPGMRLGAGLVTFWNTRGHVREGREWLTALLTLPGASAHTSARAGALDGAGYLAFRGDDPAEARQLYEASLSIGRELSLPTVVRSALQGLGRVALRVEDYERAYALFAESREVSRQADDRRGVAVGTHGMAESQRCLRQFDQAIPLYEEVLGLWRELGDDAAVVMDTANLGCVALLQGDTQRARALLAESARQEYAQGNMYLLVHGLAALGNVAAQEGAAAQAAQTYGAVETQLERAGMTLDPSDHTDYERYLALARSALDADTFATAWARGRVMSLAEAVDFACAPTQPATPA